MSTLGVWYDCAYIIQMAWHKSCSNVNTLAPGRPGCHFKTAIFNLVLLIGFFISFNDNALRWMPWDLTDDKSTLVQVMAWCRQATSHYLSQCWHRSVSPYGVTRPEWVNKPLENNQQRNLIHWSNVLPVLFMFGWWHHNGPCNALWEQVFITQACEKLYMNI